MKQLGSIVPILLLLGVGITSGLAAAELTASQQVQPQIAAVGETATVTLTLAYNGGNATQIMVVPILPPGIITDMPGTKAASLSSGSSMPISYPIRAVESGNYLITSQISYTEESATRRLNMVSEFTATGGSAPSNPATSNPGQSTSMPPIPGESGSSVPAPLLQSNSMQSVPGSMIPGPIPSAASAAGSSPDGGNNSSSPPN